jgi:hypothetical protein
MSSDIHLGCGLCGITLEPNTRCDHVSFIREERQTSENQTVIVKKSIFGDKTRDEVKVTHYLVDKLVCRCGVSLPAVLNGDCDRSMHRCLCKKIVMPGNNNGRGICIKKESSHICCHNGVVNRLQWLDSSSTDFIRHPSGLLYQDECRTCDGHGKCWAETYQRCDVCQGTGGLKCITCGGYGSVPRTGSTCCAFSDCPKKCQMGYKSMCLACNGEQATISGERQIKCTRCIPRHKSNIQGVHRVPAPASLVRPPSPSNLSQSGSKI